jgi:hypothetical protein
MKQQCYLTIRPKKYAWRTFSEGISILARSLTEGAALATTVDDVVG